MPALINQGDSEELVKNKIIDILVFDGVDTSGITTWGIAHNRLNEAAFLLSLPQLILGELGTSARAKINALAASAAPEIPANIDLPVMSGIAVSGETLSVTDGTWTGYPIPTYSYQWQADGIDIVGATNNSFILTDDQAGQNITAIVTATNPSGPTSATSNASDPIVPTWLPENMEFFADFTTANKYWTQGDTISPSVLVSDIHPQSILVEDSTGLWTSVSANILCRTDIGLQTIPTRTNLIPNNSMTGAITGVPGNRPTGWSGGGNGIPLTATTLSTQLGFPTIDLTYSGTSTLTSGHFTQFNPTGLSAMPVIGGNVYTGSIYAALLSGHWGNDNSIPSLNCQWYDSTGATFGNAVGIVSFSGITSTLQRFSGTVTAPIGAAFAMLYARNNTTDTVFYAPWTNRFAVPQFELGTYASTPILTTNSVVTHTGNIQTIVLPIAAQTGIGGWIKVDTKGFTPTDLPVLLGINPSAKIAQSIMTAANDLGNIGTGIKTIVFAASPDYTKARLLGGADVASIAGSYQNDVVSLSLGGNGFDAQNNLYAVHKQLSLRFGAMNDTIFNEMYGIAV